MSSISNKNSNKDFNEETASVIDVLALDFGLYPGSKKLRESLRIQQNENKNITIMDVKTKQISSADWDDVLDNILKAKHCITL